MQFKTWKTIKLGTGLKTGDDFRRALKEAGCGIAPGRSAQVNTILDGPTFKVAPKEIEVDLVNVSLAELGLPEGMIYDTWATTSHRPGNQLYIHAQDLGLDLSPAEVGPQLCLQYLDQPITKEMEFLNIGMEPVITTPGPSWKRVISIFMIYNDSGELGLMTTKGGNQPWSASERFMFLKRK